jgi:hypothetical protein
MCLPPRACVGPGCPPCAAVLFAEDWESGVQRWHLPRGGTQAITAISEPSSVCPGVFLRETERFNNGRVFTRASIPVVAGRTYCVSSWIRGSAGTAPFIGIRSSTAAATLGTQHWLIGQPCYDTDLGPPVAPVKPDGTWRWYAREFVMPEFTHIVLELELWDQAAAGTADFDQVQFLEGPCPGASPAAPCSAAACAP